MMITRFVAFLVASYAASLCSAALVVTIGNGTPVEVLQGTSSATIQVSLTNTDAVNAVNLVGYNLFFDVGGDGFGVPGGTSIFTSSPFGVAPLAFNTTPANLQIDDDNAAFFAGLGAPVNFDYIVGDTRSGDLSLGAGQTTQLFNFVFDVASDAALGDYAVNFVPVPVPAGVNAFSAISPLGDTSLGTPVNGVIRIVGATAVPEPASTTCLAGMFVAGGLYRWRKRKASAKV